MRKNNSNNPNQRPAKIKTTEQKALFELGELFAMGEDSGAILPADETGQNPLEIDTNHKPAGSYGILNKLK